MKQAYENAVAGLLAHREAVLLLVYALGHELEQQHPHPGAAGAELRHHADRLRELADTLDAAEQRAIELMSRPL
jgi:hypothetical protein